MNHRVSNLQTFQNQDHNCTGGRGTGAINSGTQDKHKILSKRLGELMASLHLLFKKGYFELEFEEATKRTSLAHCT